MDADEEILLDGNALAEGHDYFSIGGYDISDNDQILAYSIDTISRRNYTLYFKNLQTGELYQKQLKIRKVELMLGQPTIKRFFICNVTLKLYWLQKFIAIN
jgi:protease II